MNGKKGAKRRIGEKLRGDQQIILLSLRREEEISNLQYPGSDLTKGRLEWEHSGRRQKLEAPLDSSMSLGRPQARKSSLSSHETTIPVKP